MGRVKRSTAEALAARKAQGEHTRLEILRAADETFAAHGYQGTTMAAIAERSGVAVQTVYFYFHNKPKLLAELIGQAVMGFDRPETPEDTSWFAAALSPGYPRSRLRLFAEGGLGIFQRASVAAETARVAATIDPGVAEIHRNSEKLREEQFRRLGRSLADQGHLRAGVTADRATDQLLLLASAHSYLYLTRDRGWTDREWVEWLSDALARQLLGSRKRHRVPDRRRRGSAK